VEHYNRLVMTRISTLFAALLVLAAQPTVTVFDGARLIFGDDRPPIDRGVLVVQTGRIIAAGERGRVAVPEGAVRVDLSGTTVMPALVNLHGHVGFQRGQTYAAENYTRDNILDNLNRYADYGVGTIVSMGTDAGEIPYEIRREQSAGRLGGAFLRHAGRGFAWPNAGPGAAALRAAPYGVTSAEEARRSVRELVEKRVDVVKIWVDDRNGSVPKLPPEIYRAIIDEAHAHKLRVVAHVYYLADAKALARAGIDGLAHPVRDAETDDELIALLKARDVFVMANLGLAERGSRATDRASTIYRNMEQSIGKLNRAGVRVLLGSDSGVQNHLAGAAEHRELELMVQAGMTPSETIAAATGRAAAALGFEDVGVLAPGKIADFLVLEANPLESISNTKRISRIYLRGVALDRAARSNAAP
jgi:imidazolonepropionase-like amidohydrolase